MKLRRRNFLHLAAAAAALPALSRSACAQPYPVRPITIIVPFGPGSDFGLYYIDLDHDPNLLRKPTHSAELYKEIIRVESAPAPSPEM